MAQNRINCETNVFVISSIKENMMTIFITLLLVAGFSAALWKSTQAIGLHLTLSSMAVAVAYVLGMNFGASFGFAFTVGVMLTELIICSRQVTAKSYAA